MRGSLGVCLSGEAESPCPSGCARAEMDDVDRARFDDLAGLDSSSLDSDGATVPDFFTLESKSLLSQSPGPLASPGPAVGAAPRQPSAATPNPAGPTAAASTAVAVSTVGALAPSTVGALAPPASPARATTAMSPASTASAQSPSAAASFYGSAQPGHLRVTSPARILTAAAQAALAFSSRLVSGAARLGSGGGGGTHALNEHASVPSPPFQSSLAPQPAPPLDNGAAVRPQQSGGGAPSSSSGSPARRLAEEAPDAAAAATVHSASAAAALPDDPPPIHGGGGGGGGGGESSSGAAVSGPPLDAGGLPLIEEQEERPGVAAATQPAAATAVAPAAATVHLHRAVMPPPSPPRVASRLSPSPSARLLTAQPTSSSGGSVVDDGFVLSPMAGSDSETAPSWLASQQQPPPPPPPPPLYSASSSAPVAWAPPLEGAPWQAVAGTSPATGEALHGAAGPIPGSPLLGEPRPITAATDNTSVLSPGVHASSSLDASATGRAAVTSPLTQPQPHSASGRRWRSPQALLVSPRVMARAQQPHSGAAGGPSAPPCEIDFAHVRPRIRSYWLADEPAAQAVLHPPRRGQASESRWQQQVGGGGSGADDGTGQPGVIATDFGVAEGEPATAAPPVHVSLSGAAWEQVQEAIFAGSEGGSSEAPPEEARSVARRLRSIQSLRLHACRLTPAHLLQLPVLPGLASLDLSDNPLTGLGDPASHAAPGQGSEALYWLAFAPHLSALTLRGCALTDVPPLYAAPQLARLDVSCNELRSVAGLEPVARTLTALDVRFNNLGSLSALRPLSGVQALRSLRLHPNPLTLAVAGGGAFPAAAAALAGAAGASSSHPPAPWRHLVAGLLPQLLELDDAQAAPSSVSARQARESVLAAATAGADAPAAAASSSMPLAVARPGAANLRAPLGSTLSSSSPKRPARSSSSSSSSSSNGVGGSGKSVAAVQQGTRSPSSGAVGASHCTQQQPSPPPATTAAGHTPDSLPQSACPPRRYDPTAARAQRLRMEQLSRSYKPYGGCLRQPAALGGAGWDEDDVADDGAAAAAPTVCGTGGVVHHRHVPAAAVRGGAGEEEEEEEEGARWAAVGAPSATALVPEQPSQEQVAAALRVATARTLTLLAALKKVLLTLQQPPPPSPAQPALLHLPASSAAALQQAPPALLSALDLEGVKARVKGVLVTLRSLGDAPALLPPPALVSAGAFAGVARVASTIAAAARADVHELVGELLLAAAGSCGSSSGSGSGSGGAVVPFSYSSATTPTSTHASGSSSPRAPAPSSRGCASSSLQPRGPVEGAASASSASPPSTSSSSSASRLLLLTHAARRLVTAQAALFGAVALTVAGLLHEPATQPLVGGHWRGGAAEGLGGAAPPTAEPPTLSLLRVAGGGLDALRDALARSALAGDTAHLFPACGGSGGSSGGGTSGTGTAASTGTGTATPTATASGGDGAAARQARQVAAAEGGVVVASESPRAPVLR